MIGLVRWGRTGPNLKRILSVGVGLVRWRRSGMWDETWDFRRRVIAQCEFSSGARRLRPATRHWRLPD